MKRNFCLSFLSIFFFACFFYSINLEGGLGDIFSKVKGAVTGGAQAAAEGTGAAAGETSSNVGKASGTITKIGDSLIGVVKGFNEGVRDKAYKSEGDDKLSVFSKKEGAETISLHYDFGLNDIDKPFKPIVADMTHMPYAEDLESAVKIAEIFEGGFSGGFAGLAKSALGFSGGSGVASVSEEASQGTSGKHFVKAVDRVNSLLKKIPFFPKDVSVGVDKITDYVDNIAELSRETVFFIQLLSLFNSALDSSDSISFDDVPSQLIVLLTRLSITANTKKTISANGGEKDESKWTKKVLYRDTGIDGISNQAYLPSIVKQVIQGMSIAANKIDMKKWEESKKQTEDSKVQYEYGVMRKIANCVGYGVAIKYAKLKLLPLIESQALTFVDKEYFVKALKVHAGRRFSGMATVFLLVEDEEIQMGIIKGMVNDRFPAILDLLNSAVKKMQAKNFEERDVKLINDAIATIKAEKEKLDPIMINITKTISGDDTKIYDILSLTSDESFFDPSDAADYTNPFVISAKSSTAETKGSINMIKRAFSKKSDEDESGEEGESSEETSSSGGESSPSGSTL